MDILNEDKRLSSLAKNLINPNILIKGITVILISGEEIKGRLKGGVQFNNPITTNLPQLTGNLEIYLDDGEISIPIDTIEAVKPTE